MKKILITLASLVLALNINAQPTGVSYTPLPSITNTVYVFVTNGNTATAASPAASPTATAPLIDTNSTIGAGLQQIITSLDSPPYYITAAGGYYPALQNKYGFSLGFFKPAVTNSLINVVGGIRADYVDGGFWMPQGNATLEVPLHPLKNFTFLPTWLSGVQVTPFTYAGIGVPLSGATIGNVKIPGTLRDNNGQATAIIGEGAAINVYSPTNANWAIDIIGDRETWSGFAGTQYRFGLLYNRKF